MNLPGWLSLWLLCCPTAVTSPKQVLPALIAAVTKSPAIQADFRQESRSRLHTTVRVEQGHLWANQQGQLRYSYVDEHQQLSKDFIVVKKIAYFYEPIAAQVTMFENFANTTAAQLLQLLWGSGALKQQPNAVKLVACDQNLLTSSVSVKNATSSQAVACLLVQANRVRLTLNQQCLPQELLIIDALDNMTIYTFSKVTLHARIDPEVFALHFPKKTSVLKAPNF